MPWQVASWGFHLDFVGLVLRKQWQQQQQLTYYNGHINIWTSYIQTQEMSSMKIWTSYIQTQEMSSIKIWTLESREHLFPLFCTLGIIPFVSHVAWLFGGSFYHAYHISPSWVLSFSSPFFVLWMGGGATNINSPIDFNKMLSNTFLLAHTLDSLVGFTICQQCILLPKVLFFFTLSSINSFCEHGFPQ